MDRTMCMSCKTKDVEYYCFSCAKTLCEDCRKSHDNNRRFQQHVVVDVDDSIVDNLECETHNELVQAFCVTCDIKVCNSCTLTSHAKHDIRDFVLGDENEEYFDHDLHCKYQSTKSILERITEVCQDFDEHIKETETMIASRKAALILQLDNEEKDLLADLRRRKDESESLLFETKKFIEDSLIEVRRVSDKKSALSRPLSRSFNVSVNGAKELISNEKDNIMQMNISLPSPHSYMVSYKFTEQAESLLGALQWQFMEEANKEETYAEESIPKFKSKWYSDSTDTDSLKHDSLEATPSMENSGVELMWTADTSHEVQTLEFFPDRSVLTIEGGRSTVLGYYDQTGSRSFVPFTMPFSNPTGVAINRETGTVAITSDTNCMYGVWTKEDDDYSYTGHKMSDPYGIAFTPDHDLIIGNEAWTSQSIARVQLNGDKVWEKKLSKFKFCRHIAVDTRGIIMITDQDNFKGMYGSGFQVHSWDGSKLFSLPFEGQKHRLKEPRGICTDSENNIYVADRKRKCVCMFSPDGDFVRNIVNLTGRPRAVGVYGNRYLAVGTEDKELRMYDIGGLN